MKIASMILAIILFFGMSCEKPEGLRFYKHEPRYVYMITFIDDHGTKRTYMTIWLRIRQSTSGSSWAMLSDGRMIRLPSDYEVDLFDLKDPMRDVQTPLSKLDP